MRAGAVQIGGMDTTPPATTGSQRAKRLQSRLIEFGAECCVVVRGRHADFRRSHIAKQLVRSSTAPAAVCAEARQAESRRDFLHKMRVCLKELRETAVWLRLAARERPAGNLDTLTHECSELIAIFVASVKTAEANAHRQSNNPDRNR